MNDYCTWWPDRIGSIDWSQCCAGHDVAYGAHIDKLGADLALAHCVTGVAGWPMGAVMFIGVTLFGGLWWWKAGRTRR